MAADPHGDMREHDGRAPLGSILVRRGVLTDEQLVVALAEQARSGEKLGEVIVRLGFTVGPTVGLGLAAQHGGPLKTEYGYAVGRLVAVEPAADAEQRVSASPPVMSKAAPPATTSSTERRIERLEADCEAAEAALDAARLRSAELQRRVTELQAATTAESASTEPIARTAQLQIELEEAITRIAQLEAERNGPPATAEDGSAFRFDAHAADSSHLLFAPVPTGYLLFEQEGPPPQPGSLLEFIDEDGVSSCFIVAEVGEPPLPGVTLACGYLIDAD
jgi:hypothetical protein